MQQAAFSYTFLVSAIAVSYKVDNVLLLLLEGLQVATTELVWRCTSCRLQLRALFRAEHIRHAKRPTRWPTQAQGPRLRRSVASSLCHASSLL